MVLRILFFPVSPQKSFDVIWDENEQNIVFGNDVQDWSYSAYTELCHWCTTLSKFLISEWWYSLWLPGYGFPISNTEDTLIESEHSGKANTKELKEPNFQRYAWSTCTVLTTDSQTATLSITGTLSVFLSWDNPPLSNSENRNMCITCLSLLCLQCIHCYWYIQHKTHTLAYIIIKESVCSVMNKTYEPSSGECHFSVIYAISLSLIKLPNLNLCKMREHRMVQVPLTHVPLQFFSICTIDS